MSIQQRLRDFIKSEKITVRKFEQTIGAANGYVNGISGVIRIDKIEAIVVAYPTLNLDWLFIGRGEMRLNLSKIGGVCLICPGKDEQINFLKSQIEKMHGYVTGLIETKKGEAVEDVACVVAS
jgi:hypothetical protein